jgi:hypothetical protein
MRQAKLACALTLNWHARRSGSCGERDELRSQVRLELGNQLEELGSRTFTDRINELTRNGQVLAGQHQHAASENQLLRQRVTELEDELAATRTSLRRMIRNKSLS